MPCCPKALPCYFRHATVACCFTPLRYSHFHFAAMDAARASLPLMAPRDIFIFFFAIAAILIRAGRKIFAFFRFDCRTISRDLLPLPLFIFFEPLRFSRFISAHFREEINGMGHREQRNVGRAFLSFFRNIDARARVSATPLSIMRCFERVYSLICLCRCLPTLLSPRLMRAITPRQEYDAFSVDFTTTLPPASMPTVAITMSRHAAFDMYAKNKHNSNSSHGIAGDTLSQGCASWLMIFAAIELPCRHCC